MLIRSFSICAIEGTKGGGGERAMAVARYALLHTAATSIKKGKERRDLLAILKNEDVRVC